MQYHKVLDKDAIDQLGKIEYEKQDMYVFEGITIGYEDQLAAWFHENRSLSFTMAAIYFVVIFGIKSYMSRRPRFDLRVPMIGWSVILAIFSIFGAARSIPELVYVVRHYGFHHSVCHPSFYYGIPGFWSVLFVLSKPWELGDTLFIVLRKQKLIFLHWYHHITVMIFCWYTYPEHLAPGRWFFVMNYTVHAFMYTYYTARALQLQTPKWVSMAITTMQIIQMIVGTAIHVYAYAMVTFGHTYCQANQNTLLWGLAMYLSYFILFGNFFYQTYIKAKPGSRNSADSDKKRRSSDSSKIDGYLDSEKNKSVSNIKGGPIIGFAINEMFKNMADIERSGYLKKDS